MRAAIVAGMLVAFAQVAHAETPRAQLGLRGEPHVGLPFELELAAEGFDESPQPEVSKLEIPGAKITPLNWTPSTSRSIQIVNGHRSDTTRTTWGFRWRITIDKPGPIRIPAVTVTQGSKRAVSNAGDVEVNTVPTTDDMRIELVLPQRPVFVGESIEAKLVWLFRRQPRDQSFIVPLLTMPEITASVPSSTTGGGQRTLSIAVGTKELDLPFSVDQTEVDGQQWNRVTLKFLVAPRQAGKLQIAPAGVVAALEYGRADFFGNAPTKLFRATDTAKTFEVKPLPETDRPPSFAGAVGTQFSMQVGTSRSVVQLGEPVELTITVKSSERLDNLALGRLDGPGGLPKDKFLVPADPPTGELSDDGKTKTFKVVAQVTGPANEIPALAFSYFDPVKSTYQTIHSDPIAVSVKGSAIVGANDVVAAPTKKSSPNAPVDTDLALVGADLALSSPSAVASKPFGGTVIWILVALLYAIPLLLFAARTWQLRTADVREEAAEVRAARHRAEQALARAAKDPARDTAGPLVAALRDLARTTNASLADDNGLLARIETEAFAPDAAASPLSADLRISVEHLLRKWAKHKPTRAKAAALATLLAVVLGPSLARADEQANRTGVMTPSPALSTAAASQALADGRKAYEDAMQLTDPTARKGAFARAEVALGQAANTTPDRPELLADWGNAALGAGDLATATLAYRRALLLDPSNARARHNLEWIRSKHPETLRPRTTGATDTLFFFHTWPRARRLVVGAVAFAVAVLLVVPWAGRRRRSFVGVALLSLAIWLAMLGSLAFEDRHEDDAVVMDAVVLRAADSGGAPAALSTPLPRGTEVTVVERRDAWTKIQLPNGTAGWVPGGAVEPVTR